MPMGTNAWHAGLIGVVAQLIWDIHGDGATGSAHLGPSGSRCGVLAGAGYPAPAVLLVFAA
jgi:hypothetical protein